MALYFVFDLDGTLVDNIYEHILAWKAALEEERIGIPTWRIHRRIGMSGTLLVRELAQELDMSLSSERVERIHKRHGEIFKAMAPEAQPLPGASDLLRYLTERGIGWAIATSAHAESASAALAVLGVDADNATIITGDQVQLAKSEPDLFLEAAKRLKRSIDEAIIVGDSVWDMIAAKRAGAAGVGLLCGGTSNADLTDAGATLICNDPSDLMPHVEELSGPI